MSYVLFQVGRLYRSFLSSLKQPELSWGKFLIVTLNYTKSNSAKSNRKKIVRFTYIILEALNKNTLFYLFILMCVCVCAVSYTHLTLPTKLSV